MFHNLQFAYLDPGAGSIAIQMVVAGALGAVMLVKIFWRKLTKPFRRRDGSPRETDAEDVE